MNMHRRNLLDMVKREIGVATGRRYLIDFEPLDDNSLRELARALRDLDAEKRMAVNQARRMPWRRA